MKKQGNISLMVLFILLACSLLGLLTLHFVESMFVQSSQIFGYYKSYYLAKAGTELSLSQLKHRGVGFTLHLGSGDALVRQNFTPLGEYFFDTSLVGRSSLLSRDVTQLGCQSPFVLLSGDSLVVPLFFDDFTGSVAESFQSSITYRNLSNVLNTLYVTGVVTQGSVSLGLLVSSGTDLYENGLYFTTGYLDTPSLFSDFSAKANRLFVNLDDVALSSWNTNPLFQNYLVIANTSNHLLSFCLAVGDGELPMQQYWIKSFGVYAVQKLGLEAVYQQPIPSFLIDSSMGK